MIDLFTPARFGAIELANRIVMSSLTRNRSSVGRLFSLALIVADVGGLKLATPG